MAGLFGVVAVAAMVGAMTESGAVQQPVRLDVQADGAANIIRVIAESSATCTATYELSVTGNDGGNRSVNRGTIRLPSSGAVTVATVRVGGGDGSGTTATLDVTPCDGKAYQQVWKSEEGPARG
jgi:hypothetical protein